MCVSHYITNVHENFIGFVLYYRWFYLYSLLIISISFQIVVLIKVRCVTSLSSKFGKLLELEWEEHPPVEQLNFLFFFYFESSHMKDHNWIWEAGQNFQQEKYVLLDFKNCWKSLNCIAMTNHRRTITTAEFNQHLISPISTKAVRREHNKAG